MNIYVGLEKNEAWRLMCAERYVEVVYTYFNPERLIAIVDELADAMRPEMERHIARWGRPKSMADWEGALDLLRNIIRNRPQYALDGMQSYFGISDEQMAEWVAKYSG